MIKGPPDQNSDFKPGAIKTLKLQFRIGGGPYKLDQGTPTTMTIIDRDFPGPISAGGSHTCAVLNNGKVTCWGDGASGKLGHDEGDGLGQKDLPALTTDLGKRAVQVVAGLDHTCALLVDGSVKCWGKGDKGQMGNGLTTAANTKPVVVNLPTDMRAAAIASGPSSDHTCAIFVSRSNADAESKVYCWGSNDKGQIGNGSTTQAATPVATEALGDGVAAIAVGGKHTCAVLGTREVVKCWGQGNLGQIGNGATADKTSPTDTSSLGAGKLVAQITAGGHHTCVLLNDHSVKCWGQGASGQLGYNGTTDKTEPTLINNPAVNGAVTKVVAISAGSDHTCAIFDDAVKSNLTDQDLDDGLVKCWGKGDNARVLGKTSDITNKTVPASTESLGTGRLAAQIAAGGAHTCALLDDDRINCWGKEARGSLVGARISPRSMGLIWLGIQQGILSRFTLGDNSRMVIGFHGFFGVQ